MANSSNRKVKQNETEYTPTAQEKKLLEALLNPDLRSKKVKVICDKIKIDRNVYYRAMKKEGFRDLLNREAKAIVGETVIPIINAFRKEAEKGSFWHGKILLEMAGMYTEKQEIKVEGTIDIAKRMKEARERVNGYQK
jgi:hypothetical protein